MVQLNISITWHYGRGLIQNRASTSARAYGGYPVIDSFHHMRRCGHIIRLGECNWSLQSGRVTMYIVWRPDSVEYRDFGPFLFLRLGLDRLLGSASPTYRPRKIYVKGNSLFRIGLYVSLWGLTKVHRHIGWEGKGKLLRDGGVKSGSGPLWALHSAWYGVLRVNLNLNESIFDRHEKARSNVVPCYSEEVEMSCGVIQASWHLYSDIVYSLFSNVIS